jgi:hypothetical protein
MSSSDEFITENIVANLNQKVFFTSKEYSPDNLQVFKNGEALTPGVDVLITSGTYVELTTAANTGDIIIIRGYTTESVDGINQRKDTFFARLGFDFDANRFGEALTVSGFNKSFYESNPVKLRGWQKNFLKTGVYGNFFQNPFADILPAIKTNLSIIRNTCEEIIIAATPIYTTSILGGTTLVKPGKEIPLAQAQISDLRRVSNSAVVTISEIDKFFSHTDRISGVKSSVSADPDYERGIRVGTNIAQIVNAADGIDDFSPILGSFTSLFIKDEVVFYSNGIENFINENNEVITIDSWDAGNYFQNTTIASRNWSLANSFYTTNNFSVALADTVGRGLFFKPDGTAMYFSGDNGNTLCQYTLPEPWNIASATLLVERIIDSTSNPNYNAANNLRGLAGIFLRSDGKKLYQADGVGSGTAATLSSCIYEYDLGDAWNIATASCGLNQFINVETSAASVSTELGSALRFPSSVYFNDTGTKMFVLISSAATPADVVLQYKLTTPWSVNTAVYETKTQSLRTTSAGILTNDLKFSYDGKKMFINEGTLDLIQHYSLANPWDISNITRVETINTSELIGVEVNPTGLAFRPEGDFYYILDGGSTDRIYENRILPTFSSLNFSSNDANTLVNTFTTLATTLSTRRQHDVNYFNNCLKIANDYNKMTQLINIPNPAAIVLIRDLIGTDELKNLL